MTYNIIHVTVKENQLEVFLMQNNIKNARELQNLTQKACADALGITLRAWQTYEQGVSEPKYETLCRIADLFHVTTDYLLGREQTASEPLDDLAGQFNMSSLEKKILNNYLALPKDMRSDLMEFLHKSVQEVQAESSSN